MKILVASNMYPGSDPSFDYKGIFVKEQVDGLRNIPEFNVDTHIINGHNGLLAYTLGSIVLLFKVLFGRYNVIHCHYGLSAMFTLLIPFRCWDNVILTLHGGDILIEQGKVSQVAITKKILSRVGFVITLSDEMNSIVANYTDRYQTLVCGADGHLFEGTYKHQKITTFLFPGRPDREVKNYHFFQAIVQSYVNEGNDAEVIILDGFSRNEMAATFLKGSLLLMTSHSEGSPQVVKEAMFSDLPILSSDVGDVRNIIGDTPGTLIYGNISSTEVAQKINKLLSDALLTPGARRSRVMKAGLEQRQVIEELLKVYRKVFNYAK
jgi:teichuronic acid biosynthesis glycosyltransferase TuaC